MAAGPATPPMRLDTGDMAMMVIATTFVMLMTPAMGIAQAGMIRRKNSLSMMMQCMSGMAIGSLLWWAIGHGLAFGPDLNGDGFIGNPWPYLFFKDLPRGGESPVPLFCSSNQYRTARICMEHL